MSEQEIPENYPRCRFCGGPMVRERLSLFDFHHWEKYVKKESAGRLGKLVTWKR